MWGLVALLLPQKLLIGKLGDIRAIRRPWADYSTKRVQFIYPVDRARDHYSITEAGLGAERKERQEGVRSAHTRTEGRQTFPLQWEVQKILSRQRCHQSRSNYRYKESRKVNHQIHDDLSKMQSAEFTCPQRRNEIWQTESEPSFFVPVHEGRMLCKNCQRNGEENCSQKTTYTSKGPDVTLRKTGFTELRRK